MKNIYDYIKESILDDFDVLDKKTSGVVVNAWFEENAKGNYKIKNDKKRGVIIKGDVIIKGFDGSEFPGLNICEFNGDLIIEKCPNLISTKGLFKDWIYDIKGDLIINNCPKLSKLENMPCKIEGDFQLVGNSSLKSLEGAPEMVFGKFMAMKNGKKFSQEYVKSIIKFIDDYCIYCSDEDIEANVNEGEELNEAMNNPYLLLLAQQLKERQLKFKNVFNRFGSTYMWDKVDSSDIKKFEWRYKKPEAKYLTAAREIISDKRSGYIFVYKYDDHNKLHFTKIISSSKQVYNLDNNYDRWEAEKSTDIIDMISGNYGYNNTDGMIILYYSKELSPSDLRQSRFDAKKGIVTNDPEYYREVARNNIERYKKIVAQNKANRGSRDVENVQKIVNEFLQKVMQASNNVMKDPIKYSDRIFYLETLNEYAYNKMQYGKNGSIGRDGVLVLFNRYMDLWTRAASGKEVYISGGADKVGERLKSIEDQINKEISSARSYLNYFDVK